MHRRALTGYAALLVTLTTALASLQVVAVPMAHAAPSVGDEVSVRAVSGMVADDTHRLLFLGDGKTGQVLASDWSGRIVAAAPLAGVSDLALSPDDQVLYAASPQTQEVVALDAATLVEQARWAVPTSDGPVHLAYAGGRVWFSYGRQWSGNLGSVDPDSGSVTTGLYDGMWGSALLDASAGDPDRLAVGETGLSTDSMAVLDVSGETPVELGYYSGDYRLNEGIDDIDLVPGRAQVLVNGRLRQSYDATGRFESAGSYPSGTRADLSPTGLVATASASSVDVFRPDTTTPLSSTPMRAVALAWADDESALFVLTGRGPYSLTVLDDPALAVATLRVKAPRRAERAEKLVVRGTLTSGAALPAGVSLQVSRTDIKDPEGRALDDVPVAADGSWSFKDRPRTGGAVTYAVHYPGDADHRAASASRTVDVARDTPRLTLTPGTGSVAPGSRVTFVARLGRTHRNRIVELWSQTEGVDSSRTRVRRGRVPASGALRWTTTLEHNTVVEAVYAGDARTEPRTVTVVRRPRVELATTVTGQFKTAPLGGQQYLWFHRSDDPVVTTRMTAFPGRSLRFDFESRNSDGSWRRYTPRYYQLDKQGRLAVTVLSPEDVDLQVRVRTSYVYKASGDRANATTWGRWQYLYWTK